MVISSVKRIFSYILLFATAVILSCDESFVIVKCSECLESEPVEAKITVEFENYDVYNINLTIYEGKLEDNIVLGSYTNPVNSMEYYFPINKKYTFKAEYTDRKGVKYTAVNSVYPRVIMELEQCSVSPCYYVYDNKLNMKLKYN
jgi:hypothetical protein